MALDCKLMLYRSGNQGDKFRMKTWSRNRGTSSKQFMAEALSCDKSALLRKAACKGTKILCDDWLR